MTKDMLEKAQAKSKKKVATKEEVEENDENITEISGELCPRYQRSAL